MPPARTGGLIRAATMSATRRPSSSRPVVSPGLRRLLGLVFLLFALLAVNSLYLGSVTLAEHLLRDSFQGGFYLLMFLAHLLLGLLLLAPFVVFGALHMRRALQRSNRYAVRAGLGLYLTGLVLLLSGVLLTRFGFFEVNDPGVRGAAYWLHVTTPFLAAWLFVLHRLAGSRIRWGVGLRWASLAMLFTAAMLGIHLVDREAPRLSEQRPLFPSLARVAGGGAIPAEHLMGDEVCAECHGDIAAQSARGMHRMSSFNNPAYRFSIEETREIIGRRDGNLDNVRLCAGCHDPAPLFSGRFTAPDFDPDGADKPAADAGITCLGCHAITAVGSPRGNGDFVIQDPPRYPFAHSDNPFLQAVNRQLIKAKPEFHRATFLKPMHRSAEFCSVCHKVHLPEALNRYKWLRGQDHYDSFLLSGVSGHRVDSFYYPPRAVDRCADCHMPVVSSDDPAARDFTGSGSRGVHSHLFPGGNTGVPHLLGMAGDLGLRESFLRGSVRVDLFGLKRDGTIEGELTAPLRPVLPRLRRGESYLLETVVRTLKLGHHLTQGTADSNELWLDVTVRDGERVIARSGALGADGEADPWAYFLNAYLLDKHGNRIERRNAQDIVTALYDHQIPPGAASVVHYRLRVPADARGPISIEARVRYRKFNTAFLRNVQGGDFKGNDLPLVTLGEDRVVLALEDGVALPPQSGAVPAWERWNDYGIGLLREGGSGELRQAEAAFREVEATGRGDGPLNLARVYLREGRLDQALDALARSAERHPGHQSWTVEWLAARVDREFGRLDRAAERLQAIAATRFPQARERGFDFSRDVRVLNELGLVLYERARRERGEARRERRLAYLSQAREWFHRVLREDPENVSAHFNLARVYQELGEPDRSAHHRGLHARYKPDDQAVERVVALHRSRNPAADHAAAAVVVYDLEPSGAFANPPGPAQDIAPAENRRQAETSDETPPAQG